MWYDFQEEIPKNAMWNCVFSTFVIPDTVKRIRSEAFSSCDLLKKVYIPKSVEIVEENAFKGCKHLEIYCEDEPKAGWTDERRKEMTSYYITTPEDDAFNFHRSGGSFSSTLVEREVERYYTWNPDFRPVHTHVDRSETASWEVVPQRVLIFYDAPEPRSGMFRRIVRELEREQPGVDKLPIAWWDGAGERAREVFPHTAMPAMFYGLEKLYEDVPDLSRKQLKKTLRAIFDSLIARLHIGENDET